MWSLYHAWGLYWKVDNSSGSGHKYFGSYYVKNIFQEKYSAGLPFQTTKLTEQFLKIYI